MEARMNVLCRLEAFSGHFVVVIWGDTWLWLGVTPDLVLRIHTDKAEETVQCRELDQDAQRSGKYFVCSATEPHAWPQASLLVSPSSFY